MVPVCRPVAVAVGVKVTLTLQEAPAATDAHPVAANSVLVLVMVSAIAAVVLLVTENLLVLLVLPCAMEPNVMEVVESVIGKAPVPVRVAVCGLPVPV
jgi:hypothetical protein